jgi:hypothetical protein
MRRRGPRHAAAAWLLLLLLIPAISLALGARQPLMDNHPKTPWPSVHGGDLRDATTYKQLDTAFLERVPTRKQAVQAHSRISVGLFGESPNPDVTVGRHGWLYYALALRMCRNATPISNPADAAEITARTILASGRRALIVEPADKLLIHRADAPRYPRGVTRCVTRLQRTIASRLATIPGGVDLDATLQRMEAAGQSTFLPHDSHWNYRGRLAYARLMLDFISPGLSRATGLDVGPWYDHHSDLYVQLGLPTTDRDRAVVLQRASPQPSPTGPTVILGDSQTIDTFAVPSAPGATPMIQQLPQGTVLCPITEDFLPGICNSAILGASAIAIESVGRNLYEFEHMCWLMVGLLAQPMHGVAGRYALLDGTASPPSDRVVFGPDGKATLRVLPARGDVRREARLLRIPIDQLPAGGNITMNQDVPAGHSTPCSTQTMGSPGVALVLPLPAGRPASTVPLTFTAPPGTVLGAPQEIALTGSQPTRARRP